MPRFFIDKNDITDAHVTICGEDAKHISKVLRMKAGDAITLCDGCGSDYEAEIEKSDKDSVVASIISQKKSESEPNIEITLFQALPKSGKMEYIIQKCTELGINKIIPCIMDRCVVKLNSEADAKKKTQRYQSIALAAAKQSGRGIVPTVEMPATFDEMLDLIKRYDLSFAAYENEDGTTIKDIFKSAKDIKSIAFVIGPEGGISDGELEKIKTAGIQAVSLGKRILRTETAGETVLSMINYEFLL